MSSSTRAPTGGNLSSRGEGAIMNALNAYRAHIAAAVHDSLESHPEGACSYGDMVPGVLHCRAL
jgi:hypothetical protein